MSRVEYLINAVLESVDLCEDDKKRAIKRALRDRYRYPLDYASRGKDIQRIKLTPERIDRAKEYLRNIGKKDMTSPYSFSSREIEDYEKPSFQHMPKEHGKKAIEFTRHARRKGVAARVRFPDGPTGSAYVKMPTGETVRFADHPQPYEFNSKGNIQTVGGYSQVLGRRHFPAHFSIDPESKLTVPQMKKHFGIED